MPRVAPKLFQTVARLLSWGALCALCSLAAPARSGHLPDMADLMTSDPLGYRCLPDALEPLARAVQAEQQQDARPLPRRCMVDACAPVDETRLATVLRGRLTRADWADYQARYHAECHGRDWRPRPPETQLADLSSVPDRCVLARGPGAGGSHGLRAILLRPGGREQIYPTDWRPRQIVLPAQWHRHPEFEIAAQMMPAHRLTWRRKAPRAASGTRAIWTSRFGPSDRAGLRHVGFDDAGCPPPTDIPNVLVAAPPPPQPSLTPVPLPGGVMHMLAGLGALALVRRKGLHRRARRA